MHAAKALAALMLIIGIASAFSIDTYHSEVEVREDGGLHIRENMSFGLDQQYSEGYRSIRKEDFGSLSDITVGSVKVNGADVPYALQMNGDKAEIVWKKTYAGTNDVALDYTIRDRVEVWDDFAKVCYEHYGANWKEPASGFSARTTLPQKSAGKTMHFEVYSAKKGKAYVDNLSIVIEIENVPSGNYVGGCYLFDKAAVSGGRQVNGSAYAILKDERQSYGSETVLAPEEPNLEFCCLPIFVICAIAAAAFFLKGRGRPWLPEAILPPGKDEPVVVSALVRNEYKTEELVAATIIGLINRGVIDIVELEAEGAEKGAEIKRTRTVLMLKYRPAGLKDYEDGVLDFIFCGGEKEVDLDAKMKGYAKVRTMADAKNMPVVEAVKKLNDRFPAQMEQRLPEGEIRKLGKGMEGKNAVSAFIVWGAIFFLILGACPLGMSLLDSVGWYMQHGEWLRLALVLGMGIAILGCASYALGSYRMAAVPKDGGVRRTYAEWDAFYRGLKSSRIKEYPPASAVIWGDILVYATALGLADKVKRHLSELSALDPGLATRMDAMDHIAVRSVAYYSSASMLHNLSEYGNRHGPGSGGGGHGGFSSHSSGGWSSGGGGGFSGGSSGGGGFR